MGLKQSLTQTARNSGRGSFQWKISCKLMLQYMTVAGIINCHNLKTKSIFAVVTLSLPGFLFTESCIDVGRKVPIRAISRWYLRDLVIKRSRVHLEIAQAISRWSCSNSQ